jgi:phosphatidylglycerophosphatase A
MAKQKIMLESKKDKFLLHLSSFFGTFFYIGKIPFFPGTFGTLAGLAMILVIFYQPHNIYFENNELFFAVGGGYINPDYIIYVLLISSLALHIFGHVISDIYSRILGVDDPKEIVIDEVAGIFTTCSLIALFFALMINLKSEVYLVYMTLASYYFVAAFILFRFFDMVKPWPVSWADENIKGGFGIMLDDQIAAIMSAITFAILFLLADHFELLYPFISVK